MISKITKEFLPKSHPILDSLSKFYDFNDIFFFVSIYIYKEIIAPPTKQKVIEDIVLQVKKITALDIIIISLAGLTICYRKLEMKLLAIIAVAAAVKPKNTSFICVGNSA